MWCEDKLTREKCTVIIFLSMVGFITWFIVGRYYIKYCEISLPVMICRFVVVWPSGLRCRLSIDNFVGSLEIRSTLSGKTRNAKRDPRGYKIQTVQIIENTILIIIKQPYAAESQATLVLRDLTSLNVYSAVPSYPHWKKGHADSNKSSDNVAWLKK